MNLAAQAGLIITPPPSKSADSNSLTIKFQLLFFFLMKNRLKAFLECTKLHRQLRFITKRVGKHEKYSTPVNAYSYTLDS